MLDLVVVGHLSHDTILRPETSYESLGGSAAYTSVAAQRLGLNVGIVSAVGRDFKKSYSQKLRSSGVDTSGIVESSKPTTSFENAYREGMAREQRVLRECQHLSVEQIPLHYYEADFIHFAPLLREIDPDFVSEVSKHFENSSLDLQGLCRSVDEQKRVVAQKDPDIARFLASVEVVKGTESEILLSTDEACVIAATQAIHNMGPLVIIATRGADGSLLSVDGQTKAVTSFSPRRIVDPTGAGDAFIGGFISSWLRTQDPRLSAIIGSCVASFAVENVGLESLPSLDALRKRLSDAGYALPTET